MPDGSDSERSGPPLDRRAEQTPVIQGLSGFDRLFESGPDGCFDQFNRLSPHEIIQQTPNRTRQEREDLKQTMDQTKAPTREIARAKSMLKAQYDVLSKVYDCTEQEVLALQAKASQAAESLEEREIIKWPHVLAGSKEFFMITHALLNKEAHQARSQSVSDDWLTNASLAVGLNAARLNHSLFPRGENLYPNVIQDNDGAYLDPEKTLLGAAITRLPVYKHQTAFMGSEEHKQRDPDLPPESDQAEDASSAIDESVRKDDRQLSAPEKQKIKDADLNGDFTIYDQEQVRFTVPKEGIALRMGGTRLRVKKTRRGIKIEYEVVPHKWKKYQLDKSRKSVLIGSAPDPTGEENTLSINPYDMSLKPTHCRIALDDNKNKVLIQNLTPGTSTLARKASYDHRIYAAFPDTDSLIAPLETSNLLGLENNIFTLRYGEGYNDIVQLSGGWFDTVKLGYYDGRRFRIKRFRSRQIVSVGSSENNKIIIQGDAQPVHMYLGLDPVLGAVKIFNQTNNGIELKVRKIARKKKERRRTKEVISYRSARISDVGRLVPSQGKGQEDYFGEFVPESERMRKEKGVLAIIADGAGGHRAGGLASQEAVWVFEEYMLDNYFNKPAPISVDRLMKEAFAEANNHLRRITSDYSDENKPGTTMVAALAVGNRIYIANVGDSRAYIMKDRESEIRQVTKDHSWVQDQIDEGFYTVEDEKRKSEKIKHRNWITRALGWREEEKLNTREEIEAFTDVFVLEGVQKGDRVLLCTDGLIDKVADWEIARIIKPRNKPIIQLCRELIDIANQKDGTDNTTVFILEAV